MVKRDIFRFFSVGILVFSLLIVSFNISPILAETYETNPYVIGAYNHFLNRNMNYKMSVNYSYHEGNPFNNLLVGVSNGTYIYPSGDSDIQVMDNNNNILGPFKGWSTVASGQNPSVIYINASGVQQTCATCHLSIDNRTYTVTGQLYFDHVNDIYGNGNIENSNLYSYVYGTYSNIGSYNYSKADYIYPNQDQRFIFAVSSSEFSLSGNALNNSIVTYTQNSSYSITTTTQRLVSGGISIYVIKFNNVDNVSNWFNFDITSLNGNNYSSIIPLWWGDINKMNDEIYSYIFGNLDITRNQLISNSNDLLNTNNSLTTTTNNLLTTNNTLTTNTNSLLNDLKTIFTTGNSSSQSSVNNANSMNNQLSNNSQQLENQEQQLVNDFSTNINQVDSTLDLSTDSKMISGANYIKQNIDWITNNMPSVNLIINYSLLLGIATLIIGKRLS